MLGDFQYLSPSNESLIEKKKKRMQKKPKWNDKSHGPIKSNEAPNKERAKESKVFFSIIGLDGVCSTRFL